jgi:CheY-like chemotaxis protein
LFAGRKLLVADDSPYYRTVISLTFADEGMEVTTAGDGPEALGKLEQSTPDVILANGSLPGIGGYELCELIKQSERFAHIPVMLLVGPHELFDEAEARRVGADDLVTKPFKSIRQLVSRVGSLLGGKAADPEDTGREYSTLGLGRSVAIEPSSPERPVIDDIDVNGDIESPLMADSKPTELTVESPGSAGGADIELQTADTQRLDMTDAIPTAAADVQTMEDTNVKVFIEAATIPNHDPAEPEIEGAGSTCGADVELQTANTQKLERVDDEPTGLTIEPNAYAQDDTMEMTPRIEASNKSHLPDVESNEHPIKSGASEMNEEPNTRSEPSRTQPVLNDALLDLGDFDSPTPQLVEEDLFLDLDYEEVASGAVVVIPETISETAFPSESALPAEVAAPEPISDEQPVADHELSMVTETPAAETIPATIVTQPESTGPGLSLSPETIDAIARRTVEHLSEKVVREIAWEVVPELAELLIKKKLDEQK